MDFDGLEEFLILAKKSTYADASSNSKSNSLRSNSKDYEFKNNDFTYHDTLVPIFGEWTIME